MKASLRKLQRFALHRNEQKEKRGTHHVAQEDELLHATQDMLDMRDSYDSLLSAAAATANSAYELSEALREMGTCLLEKITLNDNDETSKVLLTLGKAQFELQKLVDSYRVHVTQTITTPSESLLKELQIVEEMKRQCDDKRDLYKLMLAAQRDKGRTRHNKGETFSVEQLQQAQEDYQEEATLFVFRLKSLKQGQFRSILTQAARHHAAQLNFFRKGVKSLEVVEPHVKVVAEQQHIDYQFCGLEDENSNEDDGDIEDDNSGGYDGNDYRELSFDYCQNDHRQDVSSMSRNSMEESLDKNQADFLPSSRGPRDGIQSAPILPDKKIEPSERIKLIQPSLSKKFHTYVLPTPGDISSSSLSGSSKPIPRSQLESKGDLQAQLWHSSPLQPNMNLKYLRDDDLRSPTRSTQEQSVLKESNINSSLMKIPPRLSEGSALPRYSPENASDTKKSRREAFSGPLPSNTWSSKPVANDSVSSVKYPHAATKPTIISRPKPLMPPKVSPGASPPLSSPRINELHELPRPPINSTKPTRPPSLVAHSAPLVPRGQECCQSKMPSIASQTASPLPTPPGVMARSFSIPSSGQRTPRIRASKLPSVPYDNNPTMDVSSPPLTPLSLANTQATPPAFESHTQDTKT
ncbi:uncharacterized protein At2g33490-like [Typha angustifolia]|uniref:uncharacterized protein At2g33490-like n=1 Tax=Typha angustifolia TaxID=59011 RepID=UPI003C2B9210